MEGSLLKEKEGLNPVFQLFPENKLLFILRLYLYFKPFLYNKSQHFVIRVVFTI